MAYDGGTFFREPKRYSSSRKADLRIWVVFTYIVLAIAIAIFAIMLIGRQVNHHMSAISCKSWGQANNRTTKFVDYNTWDYGCVTRTVDGKWIPTTQVVGISKAAS